MSGMYMFTFSIFPQQMALQRSWYPVQQKNKNALASPENVSPWIGRRWNVPHVSTWCLRHGCQQRSWHGICCLAGRLPAWHRKMRCRREESEEERGRRFLMPRLQCHSVDSATIAIFPIKVWIHFVLLQSRGVVWFNATAIGVHCDGMQGLYAAYVVSPAPMPGRHYRLLPIFKFRTEHHRHSVITSSRWYSPPFPVRFELRFSLILKNPHQQSYF